MKVFVGNSSGVGQGLSSSASGSPLRKPRSTSVRGGTTLDRSGYKEMGPSCFENPRAKERRYTHTLFHSLTVTHSLTLTHASSEPLGSQWFGTVSGYLPAQ